MILGHCKYESAGQQHAFPIHGNYVVSSLLFVIPLIGGVVCGVLRIRGISHSPFPFLSDTSRLKYGRPPWKPSTAGGVHNPIASLHCGHTLHSAPDRYTYIAFLKQSVGKRLPANFYVVQELKDMFSHWQ